MAEKTYFATLESLKLIKKWLEDSSEYSDQEVADLHDSVFNQDYYIIGTREAKQALSEFEVWDAIGTIKAYEEENFGEVQTDLSNPVEVANMLEYILTDTLFNDYNYNFVVVLNNYWDSALNEKISETKDTTTTVKDLLMNALDKDIKDFD